RGSVGRRVPEGVGARNQKAPQQKISKHSSYPASAWKRPPAGTAKLTPPAPNRRPGLCELLIHKIKLHNRLRRSILESPLTNLLGTLLAFFSFIGREVCRLVPIEHHGTPFFHRRRLAYEAVALATVWVGLERAAAAAAGHEPRF